MEDEYITKNAFEIFSKELAKKSLSLEDTEQKEIMRKTFEGMYLTQFPNSPEDETKRFLDTVFSKIDAYKTDEKIDRVKLRRIDGFWRELFNLVDKYPLIKKLPNDNYLIAGINDKAFHSCAPPDKNLFLKGGMIPYLINHININRIYIGNHDWKKSEFYIRSFNLDEKTFQNYNKYYAMEYIPVEKHIEIQFKDYLKQITNDRRYSEKGARKLWDYPDLINENLDNLIIGEVQNQSRVNARKYL